MTQTAMATKPHHPCTVKVKQFYILNLFIIPFSRELLSGLGLEDVSSFHLLLSKQDSQPSKLWHRSEEKYYASSDRQNCLVGSLPAAAGSTSEGLTQSVQGKKANGAKS
jgi:hypothetical protein